MPIEMEPVEPPEKRCAGMDGTVRCRRTVPLAVVQAEIANQAGPVAEVRHEREAWIARMDDNRVYCQAHRSQGIIPARRPNA
jgi:hypothetical protein